MTDRLQGLTVIFDTPIREDDAEQVRTAIRQIRGVAGVLPVTKQSSDEMAAWRERQRILDAVVSTIRDLRKEP